MIDAKRDIAKIFFQDHKVLPVNARADTEFLEGVGWMKERSRKKKTPFLGKGV